MLRRTAPLRSRRGLLIALLAAFVLALGPALAGVPMAAAPAWQGAAAAAAPASCHAGAAAGDEGHQDRPEPERPLPRQACCLGQACAMLQGIAAERVAAPAPHGSRGPPQAEPARRLAGRVIAPAPPPPRTEA